MAAGGRVTVHVREPTSTGWADRGTARFGYDATGVTADVEHG